MTILKTTSRPQQRSFNNFVDDFFYGFPSLLRDEPANTFRTTVPVNVTESESGYQLEVVAPGFGKEDIKIDLDKNLLTISAESKKDDGQQTVKNLRTEYRYQTFKRTFTVNNNIDTEKISAQYSNGVLFIQLPKKVEVKEPAKQIAVH